MPDGLKFTKLGVQLADLQLAYGDRLAEANLLMSSNHYGSAIAHGLYALEIYLKIIICLRLDLDALPTAFHTHDLAGLLVLSGLKRRMDALGIHPVKRNWDDLLAFNPRHIQGIFRYEPNTKADQDEARKVLDELQDPAHGVLTWLKAQS